METLVHQKIKLRHVSTRPILGYSVEMYDLPTGNWVTVTQTDDGATRQAFFEFGSEFFSEPEP